MLRFDFFKKANLLFFRDKCDTFKCKIVTDKAEIKTHRGSSRTGISTKRKISKLIFPARQQIRILFCHDLQEKVLIYD